MMSPPSPARPPSTSDFPKFFKGSGNFLYSKYYYYKGATRGSKGLQGADIKSLEGRHWERCDKCSFYFTKSDQWSILVKENKHTRRYNPFYFTKSDEKCVLVKENGGWASQKPSHGRSHEWELGYSVDGPAGRARPSSVHTPWPGTFSIRYILIHTLTSD